MVPLAALAFVKNPLACKPSARDLMPIAPGTRPIDWLQEHYPQGCGGCVHHWHNSELIDCDADDYLERPAGAGDVITLAVHPAAPLIPLIITAVIVAVVSAAITIGLSLLFPDPRAPEAATPNSPGNASPAYNVRARQNTARLGEPIPVVYGQVLMTPDIIAQAYSFYENGRGMFIDQLMCLGQGEFEVYEVLVGETEMSSIENGAAQTIVIPPSAHGGVFGNLSGISSANGWYPPFYENMWTSLEVGEQRFTYANDSSGWFRIGRAGVQTGRWIALNVEWPRGLYQMTDWGDPTGTNVNINVYIQAADADGNAIAGTGQFFQFVANNGGSLDPLRMTYWIDAGYSAAWLVKMERPTAQYPNGEEMNEYFWRALMLDAGHDGFSAAYGNTTLLMVRLRAEEVSSTADRLVRVRLARKLPVMGSGALVPTWSPADAFIDIYCNQVYGARRPITEIDDARIAVLRNSYWLNYSFNAIYTQRTTVWEAMAQTIQGVAASPLPIGGLMSIVQDGLKPVRSMMFSEQNIVRGSFKLSYHFEQTGAPDGIEVAYVDPQTWAPAYERWPLDSLSPEKINLFGCSNANQAGEFARLQWQRRQMLRRLVEFDTELEGLIPYPGERIAVAHTLPRWGASGFVASVEPDGLSLKLDRALPWEEIDPPYYMMFRDEYAGASNLVEAVPHFNGANWVTLTVSPWAHDWQRFVIGERQEQTHFVWGDGARAVKDFTLTTLAPRSGPGPTTVTISGVVYDPDVYFGTLSFLQFPVP